MSGGNGKRPPGYWPVAVRGKITWSLTHSDATFLDSASRQNVSTASRVARGPCVGRWHPMSTALSSDLRVAAAARRDAPASPLVDPPELREDLLAVGDAPGDLVERLGGEEERGPGHAGGRPPARLVQVLPEEGV